MKWITLFVFAGCFSLLSLNAETIGAKDSKKAPAQSICKAAKIDEKITIDGKLDEDIWAKTPSVKFVDIKEGTDSFYRTEGKILWDDKYLYVGFYFEEPDVRGYWGMDDAHLPDDFKLQKNGKPDYWNRAECQIMRIDRFAKVFLDPDGDGSNYLEFQISTLNNVFDSWYKQGFTDDKWGNRNQFPHIEWKCPGFLSATHVYGSINNPSDIDKGWSVEIAIPWTAMKPFVKGSCPPKDGDLWGAHLGRVFRENTGEKNTYWVWPFLEYVNCHLPDRYGKLIFEDKVPKFERFFAWSLKQDENFIMKAADIGVTDIMAGGEIKPEILKLCEKYNISIYKTITLMLSGQWKRKYPEKQVPLQELSEDEKNISELLKGNLYKEDGELQYPQFPATPENWQVTEEQKKLIEKAGKENIKAQRAYQFGGEPDKKYFGGRNQECLFCDMLCFHNPEVKDLIKELIAKELEVPGIKGIAFDFIGYVNYKCCRCPLSLKLFKEYCEKNSLKEDEKAMDKFSLESLVEFQNEMVDHIKSIKPDAVTVNHIYPVFLPEPLYVNRLKIDYCGQTAAWYFYWDPFKIYNYSKVISGEENKYFPKVKGVTFIGYYDAMKRGGMFPFKSPARVEMELRSMLRGGSAMVMMCGLDDLLENPDVADVFRKFMKKNAHHK